MLEFQNVSYSVGGRAILNDVSFALPKGRFTVLLGRNGRGKTTLLRAVNREIAHKGCILLDGVPTERLALRERARRISLLPQVLPTAEMTVGELVALGRLPHLAPLARMSEGDRAAVAHALALTEAERLAERRLSSLSGGERQRAFLAMALAVEAPILLLDEPTTYLDADARRQFLALLCRLVREEGKTVLAVLHDLNEALRTADSILLLREGCLAFCGTPEEFAAEGLPEREFGLHPHPAADGGLPFYY